MYNIIFMADLELIKSKWWATPKKHNPPDRNLPPCFTSHLLVAMASYQNRTCYAV